MAWWEIIKEPQITTPRSTKATWYETEFDPSQWDSPDHQVWYHPVSSDQAMDDIRGLTEQYGLDPRINHIIGGIVGRLLFFSSLKLKLTTSSFVSV